MSDLSHQARVLIVEDDVAQAALLRRWLEAGGIQVRHANTGNQAWELLTDGSEWNLILCDVNLPDKTGIDLLTAYRPRRRGVPFILLTAYRDFNRAVEALRKGAEDYLVKPVTRDILMGKVSACLARPKKSKARQVVMAIGRSVESIVQGCGGALLHHANQGDRVLLATVRWGPEHPSSPEAELQDRRVAHRLGASLRRLDLEASTVKEDAVRTALDDLMLRVPPDTVYAPSTHDEAGGVRVLHAAVRDSARSAVRVLAYQVTRPTVDFRPSTFVDITHHLDEKLALLDQCRTGAEAEQVSQDLDPQVRLLASDLRPQSIPPRRGEAP